MKKEFGCLLITPLVVAIPAGAQAQAGEERGEERSEETGTKTRGSQKLGTTLLPDGGVGVTDEDEQPIIDGVWTIAADARIDSVAASEPESSYGFGLGYRNPWFDVRTIVRHSPVESELLDVGERTAGEHVLTPSTLKFGATVELRVFGGDGFYCYTDNGYGTNECLIPVWRRTFQHGGFAFVNVGRTDLNLPRTDAMGNPVDPVETTMTPLHLNIGYITRLTGKLVMNATAVPLGLEFFAGPSVRLAAGDLSKDERREILGDAQLVFPGLDAGVRFQLASAFIGLTVTGVYAKTRTRGLSGGQISPFLSFTLPLSIVAEGEKAKKTTPDAASETVAKDAQGDAATGGEQAGAVVGVDEAGAADLGAEVETDLDADADTAETGAGVNADEAEGAEEEESPE